MKVGEKLVLMTPPIFPPPPSLPPCLNDVLLRTLQTPLDSSRRREIWLAMDSEIKGRGTCDKSINARGDILQYTHVVRRSPRIRCETRELGVFPDFFRDTTTFFDPASFTLQRFASRE